MAPSTASTELPTQPAGPNRNIKRGGTMQALAVGTTGGKGGREKKRGTAVENGDISNSKMVASH